MHLNFSKKHAQVDLFWVNFDSISAVIPFLPPTGIIYYIWCRKTTRWGDTKYVHHGIS